MDVGASFITDGKPATASNPRQCAFDHPAMSAQPLAAVDAAAGDPGDDRAATQRRAAARVIVGLVGVQLGGATAKAALGAGGSAG